MSLRWRKDPPERGLARIAAGPRGSTLFRDGAVRCATVSAIGRSSAQWFWVAGWGCEGVPYRNTCDQPVTTEAQAKADAMAYVKQHLCGGER